MDTLISDLYKLIDNYLTSKDVCLMLYRSFETFDISKDIKWWLYDFQNNKDRTNAIYSTEDILMIKFIDQHYQLSNYELVPFVVMLIKFNIFDRFKNIMNKIISGETNNFDLLDSISALIEVCIEFKRYIFIDYMLSNVDHDRLEEQIIVEVYRSKDPIIIDKFKNIHTDRPTRQGNMLKGLILSNQDVDINSLETRTIEIYCIGSAIRAGRAELLSQLLKTCSTTLTMWILKYFRPQDFQYVNEHNMHLYDLVLATIFKLHDLKMMTSIPNITSQHSLACIAMFKLGENDSKMLSTTLAVALQYSKKWLYEKIMKFYPNLKKTEICLNLGFALTTSVEAIDYVLKHQPAAIDYILNPIILNNLARASKYDIINYLSSK